MEEDGLSRVCLAYRWRTPCGQELDGAHNVVPVEVKSGKNASHKSLDKFVEKFSSYVDKPYLLWMKDRKEQAGVEYLPIYMAPCLAE